jgi:hypothetical protein
LEDRRLGTSFTSWYKVQVHVLVPDPETGVTFPGAPDGQIVISKAVVWPGSGCGDVMIVLCFGVTLWLLL